MKATTIVSGIIFSLLALVPHSLAAPRLLREFTSDILNGGEEILSGITNAIEGAIEAPLNIVNDVIYPDDVDDEVSGQGMLSGITKTIEGAIETPLKIVNDIMSPDEVDGETSGISKTIEGAIEAPLKIANNVIKQDEIESVNDDSIA